MKRLAWCAAVVFSVALSDESTRAADDDTKSGQSKGSSAASTGQLTLDYWNDFISLRNRVFRSQLPRMPFTVDFTFFDLRDRHRKSLEARALTARKYATQIAAVDTKGVDEKLLGRVKAFGDLLDDWADCNVAIARSLTPEEFDEAADDAYAVHKRFVADSSALEKVNRELARKYSWPPPEPPKKTR